MRSDKDEVFRFLWENRRLELRAARGAYTEVLSVRPCMRVGPDGFTLRETVAEYYQVARLTPEELQQLGISLPREYVAALRQERARGRAAGAGAPGRRGGRRDGGERRPTADADDEASMASRRSTAAACSSSTSTAGSSTTSTTTSSAAGARRSGFSYLWETGQLSPAETGARLQAARLSTIHRLRALDARRFPAEGW